MGRLDLEGITQGGVDVEQTLRQGTDTASEMKEDFDAIAGQIDSIGSDLDQSILAAISDARSEVVTDAGAAIDGVKEGIISDAKQRASELQRAIQENMAANSEAGSILDSAQGSRGNNFGKGAIDSAKRAIEENTTGLSQVSDQMRAAEEQADNLMQQLRGSIG